MGHRFATLEGKERGSNVAEWANFLMQSLEIAY
jgi:hypothetical protein